MKIDDLLSDYAAEARDLWLFSLSQDENIDEHKFSHGFHRKMNQLTRQQSDAMPPKPKTWFRRVVAVFLIAFSLSVVTFFTVEAFRIRVIDTIKSVYETYTQLGSTSTFDAEEGLNTIYVAYIPEGMEETDQFDLDGVYRYLRYEDTAGRFFELNQTMIESSTDRNMIFDTERSELIEVKISGEQGYAVTDHGETTIIWEQGHWQFEIAGDIFFDELIKIAENILIS